MGLFERIRKKERIENQVNNFFKMITAYTPAFTTFEGGVYESELCRSAINAFALHASKLKPEVKGSGNTMLERRLQYKPNTMMDTKKYIARIATAYAVDNNVIIAPLEDQYGNISGYYPLLIKNCQLVDYQGIKYIRYRFSNNQHGAVELDRCGILTNFQYDDDLWGSSNKPLSETMNLIAAQNQGIISGIKNSASIRFLAKLNNVLSEKTISEEREKFRKANLTSENNGGVLLYDNKYEDIKQIDSKPYTVNSAQMAQIKENVFDYFGVNDDILKNKYNSSTWNAFYEGKIEPFALEMSLVHTNMTFSQHEIAFGNEIMFTANRLQYLEPSEKLSVVTQLFDRGMLTQNQGLEIFNLPSIGEVGDKYFIRKEYLDTAKIETTKGDENNAGETGTEGIQGNATDGSDDQETV